MKIYLTRHGQTGLNARRLMQGRIDEPLSEVGMAQAREARKELEGIEFDAVYSSPLKRARQTACILGNVAEEKLLIDDRLIEVDFGRYERRSYDHLGLAMTLYWAVPEIFPAPKTVETIASMRERTSEFLKELSDRDYENVLIVCHGGIMRPMCGYLEGRKNGIKWRPKPKNCEIRQYELR